MEIRPATPLDLPAIGVIQAASPEAAQWEVVQYLAYDCLVATIEAAVAGFLVSRPLAGEREILNVAVSPAFRRRGIAAALLDQELRRPAEAWFLEVRPSNATACELYRKAGFLQVGTRPGYYASPPEPAIVMRKFS